MVIAHQRGESGHSEASWKRKSQRSSVEKGDIVEQHRKVDIAQQRLKSSHSTVAWKKET